MSDTPKRLGPGDDAHVITPELVDEQVERKKAARRRAESLLLLRIKVFSMRRGGASYQEIADTGLCSKTRAHQIVAEELAKLNDQLGHSVDQYRALELARLDKLLVRLDSKTRTGSPFAVIAYLKVMERRAKLLGLDKPLQLQVGDLNQPERELPDDALDREIAKLTKQVGDAASRRLSIVPKKESA